MRTSFIICVALCCLTVGAVIGLNRKSTLAEQRTEQRLDAALGAIEALTKQVSRLVDKIEMAQAGHLVQTWVSAGDPPVQQEQDTERLPGETRNDWVKRHRELYEAKMVLYPPI